ncbi:MAG: hypothetical protein Q4D62_13035, partial [Planctomycetia bacterium]|nr:hypothetical protein [Planctomycetia bacterium]
RGGSKIICVFCVICGQKKGSARKLIFQRDFWINPAISTTSNVKNYPQIKENTICLDDADISIPTFFSADTENQDYR